QLARQDDRLERVGQLVDVEHVDAAQLRDLVQVEVVRHDLAVQRTRQLNELEIDLADLGKIDVRDQHFHTRHLLNALQDVEAATAAIAFHRVGGVGHQLQFLEHELRDDERAVDEPGVADIRDPAVDDDAGVEN